MWDFENSGFCLIRDFEDSRSHEQNFVDRKVKIAVFVHFASEVLGEVVVSFDRLLLTIWFIK
jgi:hypothetical protein